MKRALTTWLILLQQDIIGVRFALNVFIGTTVTWYVLTHIADDENPIWAIASMVAASDPQVKEAVRIFWSRLINVLVGCAVGLIFVVVGGTSEWKLPIALAVTVLLSSYWVQIKTMWRQAPITAAMPPYVLNVLTGARRAFSASSARDTVTALIARPRPRPRSARAPEACGRSSRDPIDPCR